jgi:hypothetical protein
MFRAFLHRWSTLSIYNPVLHLLSIPVVSSQRMSTPHMPTSLSLLSLIRRSEYLLQSPSRLLCLPKVKPARHPQVIGSMNPSCASVSRVSLSTRKRSLQSISALIFGGYDLTKSQTPELLFYRRCITVQEECPRNHCNGVTGTFFFVLVALEHVKDIDVSESLGV